MRKEVLERRELQKTAKLRVFNAMVVPQLLYGCETWTILKRHESKLQAFEMMCTCLRRVEGVTRKLLLECYFSDVFISNKRH